MKKLLLFLIAILFPWNVAFGAIAFVNSSTMGENSGSSNTAIAPAINATAGNLIYVCGGHANNGVAVSSVTDTAGNTYTFINSALISNGAPTDEFCYYAKNITGNASNVVTMTFASAVAYRVITVMQFSGLDTTAPFDTSDSKIQSSTATITSNSFSTAKANSVIVACSRHNTAANDITAGSGYTITGSAAGIGCQYKIVSSIQSGVTDSMSGGTLNYLLLTAVFNDGVVPASSPTPILSLVQSWWF